MFGQHRVAFEDSGAVVGVYTLAGTNRIAKTRHEDRQYQQEQAQDDRESLHPYSM